MVTPVGTAMLFRAFPPRERARASAVLTMPTAIAPALGPVLGGWLVSTIKSEETGRASSLFNTNRQVAASVGVAVLTTVLLEQTAAYVAGVTGAAAIAQAQLLAFHDAFAASIVFRLVGILFALRIHDQDAAASMQPAPSIALSKEPAGVAAD